MAGIVFLSGPSTPVAAVDEYNHTLEARSRVLSAPLLQVEEEVAALSAVGRLAMPEDCAGSFARQRWRL